jgi:predicted enzyme related to lactoylglutathione lyase
MTQSFDLAWIVVKDFKKAVKFYTETVGLQIKTVDEEFGWAELQGPNGGAMLGIAVENDKDPIKAGANACLTFTVENLEKSRDFFLKKGAKFLGDIVEVPGHVKMLTGVDADGNHFQLAQILSKF